MKITTLLLLAVLISGFVAAQKQIQIIGKRFEMNAIRNGQPVKLETKNFSFNVRRIRFSPSSINFKKTNKS